MIKISYNILYKIVLLITLQSKHIKMGLDIIALSNLLIKPVPEVARAKVTPGKKILLTEIAAKVATSDAKTPEDMQGFLGLYIITHGLEESYNTALKEDKDFVETPDKIEVSPDGEAWENKEREENGLEHIDWERSRAYYRTSETTEESTGRSYSGVGDFRKMFSTLSGEDAPLLPCDGVCYAEDCDANYRMMYKVWPKWSEKYMTAASEGASGEASASDGADGEDTEAPDERKLSKYLDDIMMYVEDPEVYGMDWEKEFFLRLAKCFYLGKTCGIVYFC